MKQCCIVLCSDALGDAVCCIVFWNDALGDEVVLYYAMEVCIWWWSSALLSNEGLHLVMK